ncbi:MAG: cytochrome c oxidase accessory protein CcoG [Bacteroidales bacterium]|nr:cytochrome c oxidase accessory protein CcoG [Bacteroidales bacterium]
MNEFDENESFRDRVSTIAEDGKRLWVYPKRPAGRLFKYRNLVAYLLLIIFFATPFIKLNGDPVMLFDFLQRRFIIFGVVFFPQDFHIFVLSMITFIVFVVLFTVIFGRLFCGWICPQTIFMEFIFRQLEYLIEGNNSKQRKLDERTMDFDKLWRKSLKHLVFYLISLVTVYFFLAYVIGMDRVRGLIESGPAANWAGFVGMLIFAGVHYLVFAKLREQVCIIVCPYGRLQGVLLDRNSINVSYDYKRGEPRAKYNPLENRHEAEKGDCIDCNSCVVVCPTGIDIRNGTQLECINCTACIDACDNVMERVHKPKGLIRYASERSIAEGTKLKFNIRILFYSVVLSGLLILIGYLFSIRTDIESTILRMPGSMYQEYDSLHYSNIYTIQLINKTRKDLPVELLIDDAEGEIKMMGGPLIVSKGDVGKATFLLVVEKSKLKSSMTGIEFKVMCEGREMDEIEATFVGPNTLDTGSEPDND